MELNDSHVLRNVRSEGFVKTDSDKSVCLSSHIYHLPFLPVLAPYSNSPSSPCTAFQSVVGAVVWDARMSDLDRRRNMAGRGGRPKSASPLKSQESRSDVVTPGLQSRVRGRNEGCSVSNGWSGCQYRDPVDDRSVGMSSDSLKQDKRQSTFWE
jgi:hypothetical protein